jgi:hypothetical protein
VNAGSSLSAAPKLRRVIVADRWKSFPVLITLVTARTAIHFASGETHQWHTGWSLKSWNEKGSREMKRVQNLVLISIAAVMVTLCCVKVVRGEDPAMSNREAVTRDLTNLALRAQDFYYRPTANGGGQGSFILLTYDPLGWARLASKSTSSNGTYSILIGGTATNVVIHGQGTAKGTDGNYISVDMTVFADSTSVVYNN